MTQHTITICDWHGGEIHSPVSSIECYFDIPEDAVFTGHEYGLRHSDTIDICPVCLYQDERWEPAGRLGVQHHDCGICGDSTGPFVTLRETGGSRFSWRACLEHSPWELAERPTTTQ